MKTEPINVVEFVEKFAREESRKLGVERSRYIEWLLFLHFKACQWFAIANQGDFESFNNLSVVRFQNELEEYFSENGIKDNPYVFWTDRMKGYVEDDILINNGDLSAPPNALRNLYSAKMESHSIPMSSFIQITNLNSLDSHNVSLERFNKGLKEIMPDSVQAQPKLKSTPVEDYRFSRQQNLDFRDDVARKVEDKFQDVILGCEYPELYDHPIFLEYVSQNTRGREYNQRDIDQLASLYEDEMDNYLKKTENAIKLYQWMRALSIILFLVVIIFVQALPLMILCIVFMALFNFVGPEKIRDYI